MERKSPLLMICACCIVVLVLYGADSRSETDKAEILDLTYLEFDQTPGSGFRRVADQGDFDGAAEMIEAYLAGRKGLERTQVGYLHLHAAQLWAFHGDDDKAVGHLRQARVDSIPDTFPQTFNAYIDATLSFILEDMAGVRKAKAEIMAMSNLSYRDSTFLDSVNQLLLVEGQKYGEAALAESEE